MYKDLTFWLSYHEILYVISEATLSLLEEDSLAEALKNHERIFHNNG